MHVLLINFYIFFMAIVLAILEIQIEGEHGWAKNLPTWRPSIHSWYARAYGKLMGGKDLTGYHVTMFFFVLLIFHLPFIFGLPWSFVLWVKVLSYYFLFLIVWDFLWFVLNPHFPLRQFRKEHIWWHKKWMLGLPIDYFSGLIVSFLILIPGKLLFAKDAVGLFTWWFTNIRFFAMELIVVILIAEFVLKLNNFGREEQIEWKNSS